MNHKTVYQNLVRGFKIFLDGGIKELIHRIVGNIDRSLRSHSRNHQIICRFSIVLLSEIHLLLDEFSVAYPAGNSWQVFSVKKLEKDRKVPTINIASGVYGTLHGSKKHQAMMEQIYTYKGFVEIEEGDYIIDVGAYVGSFSLVAAKKADKVLAIDPNANLDSTLEYNTRKLNNIEVISIAAHEKEMGIDMNISTHPNENSILSVDNNFTGDSITIDAKPIHKITASRKLYKIDYLKIEAEGLEPEILKGALNSRVEIKKIAVDTTAERDGERCLEEIVSILQNNGYRWKMKEDGRWWEDKIVFARNDY